MKRLLPLIILIAATVTAYADDIQFTYNLNDGKATGYGFTSPERYDLAIFIHEPALTGAKVKGITAYLPEKGGSVAETCWGWTSTTLPEKGADCTSLPTTATGSVNGTTISITFDEPATIPAEGLYVGYTLDVTEITASRAYPVLYVTGTTPGSMFLRTTSRADWLDQAERSDRMSTMVVTLDADLPQNGASLTLADNYQVKGGTTGNVAVTVANHGLTAINSIGYKYQSDETEGEGTVNPDTPIGTLFGQSAIVNIPVKGGDTYGDTPLKITLTEINGEKNTDPISEGTSTMSVLPEVPVYRPLVEEYSGLWCMGCPAGYVALEEGRDQFGEDFVALAYHYNDAMVTGVLFPNQVSSFPTVWMDRKEDINAATTLDVWKEYKENSTDIDVQCDIEWTDNTRSNLKATDKVTSMKHQKGHFRICYALVADGLSNPNWGQANNFSGALLGGKYWDLFTKGGGYVYGLTFNCIVCLLPEPHGFENSLPAELEQFEQYTHSYTFDVNSARMAGGVQPCSDKDNLRVVAIVVNGDNRQSLNSVSSKKSSEAQISSGVETIKGETEVIMTKYYDLEGRRLISAPENIPYIRVSIFDDGTTKSNKIMPVR
ncbi:MAG: hypothetical protein J6C81_00965 [Muribaculaceae bacterium]|nr:hypothetical protein [Muribaculaceae bacterium]